MSYGIYLTLDQTRWQNGDFSSENKLSGTIYTDENRTTAKNLTGYTIKVRLYKPNSRSDRFSKEASIVSAAAGTFAYAVADGDIPTPGIYEAKVELTKSGVRESTLNHVDFFIQESPYG